MEIQKRAQGMEAAKNFHCPRFCELPDIGLYLEQTLNIVNASMLPIVSGTGKEALTGAMVSNYVKNKALIPPIKKKYGREHLCYLMAISILKEVFTVQQIAAFFEIQRDTYDLETAYNYFCAEFEHALQEAFSYTGNPLPSIETKRTAQTILVRSMVLAISNKIYAEKAFL